MQTPIREWSYRVALAVNTVTLLVNATLATGDADRGEWQRAGMQLFAVLVAALALWGVVAVRARLDAFMEEHALTLRRLTADAAIAEGMREAFEEAKAVALAGKPSATAH